MLKNYFHIALRNLLKHKGHTFINIAGLSIGIAIFLLLFLWIHDELSYDRFHSNAGNIYRVIHETGYQGKINRYAKTPAPLASVLKNEFSWIKKTVRIAEGKYIVKRGENIFNEDVFFADPGIFDIFSFPIIESSSEPKKVLEEPGTLLISERMREKYFGLENPLVKTLDLDEEQYIVKGIFKNIPVNSHMHFDFLASFRHYRKDYHNQWGIYNFWTYILTADTPPLDTFREKMPGIVTKYYGEDAVKVYKISYDLQPLTDIHLYSQLWNELQPNGDIENVILFTSISFFILLLACLNYINLASARFLTRMKEVGLRKVLGAVPGQLSLQFLGESFLVTAVALPIAVFLAKAFLPVFNTLAGKNLSFLYLEHTGWLFSLFLFVPLVGLTAGIIPALFISKANPITALSGIVQSQNFLSSMRKVLVVFQFTISIIFILVAIIIYNQLHYTQDKDLGLNIKNVITVHVNHNEEAKQKLEIIKKEFLAHPGVESVCLSGFSPGPTYWNNNYWHDGVPSNQNLSIGCTAVGYNFLKTMQIDLIEGRSFSYPTDNQNFILNQAALKEFGWKSAVGKWFDISHWKKGQVIGVVKDFNYDSLHQEVKPLVLFFDTGCFPYLQVRYRHGSVKEVIAHLEEKWKKLVPGATFEYSFLDDDYRTLYKTEWKLARIFGIVTMLALFIACLGLFGLAAYETEQRTKEIGIRKAVGATVPDILYLLAKKFISWVIIANLFAWPIAWYAMGKWLENFAYPVSISIFSFILSGVLALLIALLTVSYQTIKTARANPVKALRYE